MKKLLKSSFIITILFILFTSFIPVNAWFIINKYANVTISNIDSHYYFDVLIKKESARILTETELSQRIPEDYESQAYINAMNGYITSDGFVSFRLYADEMYQIVSNEPNVYQFDYNSTTPVSFRLAIIDDNSDIHLSEVFVMTKSYADISYDLSSIHITETDLEVTVEFAEPRRTSIWLIIVYVLSGGILPTFISLFIYYLLGYRNKKKILFMGLSHVLMFGIMLGLLLWFYGSNLIVLPFIISFVLSVIMFAQMLITGLKKDEPHPKRAMFYVLGADLLLLISSIIVFGLLI